MKRKRPNTSPTDDLELFARCAAGFELVLAQELKALHLRRVRPLKGGVAFFGSQEDAYRACLWSRVATRIQLVIAHLDAHDADALYAGATRLAWEGHVRPGATVAVQAHGTNASLPLDLRSVRSMLRHMAAGKRLLSLGSYAGVPAATAAAGGATSTTTTDASSSYLDWARRNLAANGFSGKGHHLERSPRPGTSFGLVYADVAALTEELVATLPDLLSANGTLVLVGGPRSVLPDIPRLDAEEITPQTIPHDFERTPKVHRCWLLRHQR